MMQVDHWVNDGSHCYKILLNEKHPNRYIKVEASRNTGYRFCHALVAFGGDGSSNWRFRLAIPYLFYLYVGLCGIGKFWKDGDKWFWQERETGFTFHDGILWLRLLYDDNGWCRGGFRKTKQITIDFDRLIFGSSKFSKETIGKPIAIRVPMPEGNYDATIQHIRRMWSYPRFRKPRISESTDVELEKPPRFAGKGDNEWDMDDDGIFGASFDGHLTADEAAHEYREMVLKERKKRGEPGSYTWEPQPQ